MADSGNFSQEDSDSDVSAGEKVSSHTHPDMAETREQFIERALAEYESPLIGYAYGMLRDLDCARDVVQDTFIRLCRQDINKVRDGLKSWLYTVCRNRALDVLRKDSRMSLLEDEGRVEDSVATERPDSAFDQTERYEEIMQYIGRLPENQQNVILMKFRDGLSYKEICDATGLTNGNVGFLIHTGLKRLRTLIPSDLRAG